MNGRSTHLLVALAAGALTLTGCGVTDIPSSSGPETVTVWVDPPTEGEPAPTTSSETAPPTTPVAVPTRLSGGHGRGAVGSYRVALQHIDDADRDREAREFVSPSGNLFCVMAVGHVSCEVARGRVVPPQAGICAPDGPADIGRIELTSEGAAPVCNSDSIRSRARTIGYETVVNGPGGTTACVMEELGVTCVDHTSRHGFFLSRGAFETF